MKENSEKISIACRPIIEGSLIYLIFTDDPKVYATKLKVKINGVVKKFNLIKE